MSPVPPGRMPRWACWGGRAWSRSGPRTWVPRAGAGWGWTAARRLRPPGRPGSGPVTWRWCPGSGPARCRPRRVAATHRAKKRLGGEPGIAAAEADFSFGAVTEGIHYCDVAAGLCDEVVEEAQGAGMY